jgi:hypothetical protein
MIKIEINLNHEIRNTKQSQMTKIQNFKKRIYGIKGFRKYCFENLIFEFWIYFRFRYSNFEFFRGDLYA